MKLTETFGLTFLAGLLAETSHAQAGTMLAEGYYLDL